MTLCMNESRYPDLHTACGFCGLGMNRHRPCSSLLQSVGIHAGIFFFFLYALHSYTPVVIFPRKDVHKS